MDTAIAAVPMPKALKENPSPKVTKFKVAAPTPRGLGRKGAPLAEKDAARITPPAAVAAVSQKPGAHSVSVASAGLRRPTSKEGARITPQADAAAVSQKPGAHSMAAAGPGLRRPASKEGARITPARNIAMEDSSEATVAGARNGGMLDESMNSLPGAVSVAGAPARGKRGLRKKGSLDQASSHSAPSQVASAAAITEKATSDPHVSEAAPAPVVRPGVVSVSGAPSEAKGGKYGLDRSSHHSSRKLGERKSYSSNLDASSHHSATSQLTSSQAAKAEEAAVTEELDAEARPGAVSVVGGPSRAKLGERKGTGLDRSSHNSRGER